MRLDTDRPRRRRSDATPSCISTASLSLTRSSTGGFSNTTLGRRPPPWSDVAFDPATNTSLDCILLIPPPELLSGEREAYLASLSSSRSTKSANTSSADLLYLALPLPLRSALTTGKHSRVILEDRVHSAPPRLEGSVSVATWRVRVTSGTYQESAFESLERLQTSSPGPIPALASPWKSER